MESQVTTRIQSDDRNMEEELLTVESMFRQIVDSIPVPVAVTTPDGEVEALNRATLDYFGKTFEELTGWKTSDSVHPDDLQRTIAAFTEAHKTGGAYNVESRHLSSDGTYRWFNVVGLPLRDNQGNILRWFHLQIDIDDRKNAEEALRSTEHNLSELINTIPALTWSARLDGSAEFFNQHYLEYVGLSLDEAKDWGWTAAIHPDDLIRLSADWESILASGKPGESEARLRRYDGGYRWFLFRANPLYDESGNVSKWNGVNTDIEDRKRAEALLAGEKRLLEMVAEGKSLPSILDALCRLVEETVRGYICSISLVNANCTFRDLAVAPSLPQSYNEAILKRPVNPDSGPCARAACSKEQVIVADIASDLRWDEYDWRPLSLSYGLRACWSTPILSSGNSVLGTFALYSREPGEPTPHLQNVIGQMTHLAAVAIERKLAVEKLQAKQDLLDLAQKSAGAMAFDWHIQEEINTWSPEQEALFGLAPGTFDGTYKSWKQMMYAPDWPAVVQAIHHAHETGEISAEFRVVWPNGSLHWLSTNGRMFFDDEGKPLRMVGFTSDVTPRKLAEEKLRRSEAFLAEGQNLARMGNFSWRVAAKAEDDQFTWSEQLHRIFEFEPGIPVTLRRIANRVHPDDVPMLYDTIKRAQLGLDDFENEHRILLPDGSIKYLHLIAHRSSDARAQLEYIGAVQDVTQRRIAEEALSEARSELAHAARVMSLGVLTASIAHEVSQPLSGIITNASTCVRMLDADPPNVEGARETARRMIRDGNRASDVIRRLRALFSKKAFTVESVDLNEAVQEVIALSRSELQKSQVALQAELAKDLPLVAGDRVQLQQVILNLLLNAADAMSDVDGRARQLTIETRSEGTDRVCLSVRDVGVGIASDQVEKLFDAFHTTKESGMGIGLSVSRSIIEGHRGKLWTEPPNEGPGAVFSFSIPVHGTNANDDNNKMVARNA